MRRGQIVVIAALDVSTLLSSSLPFEQTSSP
jgi:hypothetical protein